MQNHAVRLGMAAITSIAASWLGMTALHELGHVANAWMTGGDVVEVELPPRGLGHTRVWPNPRPLLVAWGGAWWGTLLPLLAWLALRRGSRTRGPATFFAGLCLIANGAYLAAGAYLGDADAADDAHELLRHGAANWQLLAFGVPAMVAGFCLWHCLGPRFGLSRKTYVGGLFIGLPAVLTALLLIVGVVLPRV
jgi:hypothetical protein